MKTAMYIDDLTAIDFSVYDGTDIKGDSISLSVMVTGEENETGMISDFGKIKPKLKFICDEEVDHRLVCDSRYLTVDNDRSAGEFPVSGGIIHAQGPSVMFCAIPMVSEDYVADIKHYLITKFCQAMPEFEFEIELTRSTTASFQYNHGLKLHDGNCQRIIHGHSSDLEIQINGQTCPKHHDWMAANLNGKHFFNANDVAVGEERTTVRYSASQGDFEVQIPNQLVEIVQGEPSIENISKHIAVLVKDLNPDAHSVRVKVSEGLSKGAVTLA
ncbi:6-carboxytetrahydropterin synthase [Vibrio palustris]|uniref:6-carboxy-5,6,7,8-tetrahydropterin synthase n=1 Tax=Vibrio palustris TaxID=1918946 RepID=A0A1R4B104_9VIBR|nr:6-carboxytetrahydropterin synthase [Vibrio palustris]SJL82600.1 6-pyruvoyl tetrahydropterin synthase [Vibrio palustris]